jgi:NADH dehydrogenase FAD-containing subunit
MTRLVLVGAGHAHMQVLLAFYAKPIKNLEIILISSERNAYYSGMLSGYLEGIYSIDQVGIPLDQLCAKWKYTFVLSTVVHVDPFRKTILMDSQHQISYDLLSFNLGSFSANDYIQGVDQYAQKIKPLERFINMRQQLLSAKQLVMVGGGATTVELASILRLKQNQQEIVCPITIICKHLIMSQSGSHISQEVRRFLLNQNHILYEEDEVISIDERKVYTKQGKALPYDQVLWLTGPAAPLVFRDSELPVNEQGFLKVNEFLQVTPFPSIFAAGDCMSMAHYPGLPKSGVYAVKQGKVLVRNIRKFIDNKPLKIYIPQKKYLAILSLGNKQGYLIYGKWAFFGKWTWKCKNVIDRIYMHKFLKFIRH